MKRYIKSEEYVFNKYSYNEIKETFKRMKKTYSFDTLNGLGNDVYETFYDFYQGFVSNKSSHKIIGKLKDNILYIAFQFDDNVYSENDEYIVFGVKLGKNRATIVDWAEKSSASIRSDNSWEDINLIDIDDTISDAYMILRDDLWNLAENTQTDNCYISFYTNNIYGVSSIQFNYTTLFSTTGYISLASFYTNIDNLDLSDQKSCSVFLNNIKNEIDMIIKNPNFSRVELKKYWKEHYEMKQSDTTECANWLYKTAPKIYPVIKNWVDKYSTY